MRFCVLLAKVDLLVPLAPDLGGSEHATGTAHVTEGGLTGTVSTTTRDTGDTGDSATWYTLAMPFRFYSRMPRPIPSIPPSPVSCDSILLSRTGTPGLSGGLVTSVLSYGVRLALVLGHAGVDVPVRVLAHILHSASCVCGGVGDFVLDNVRADGRLEDIGQGVGVLAGSPIGANDRDSRARHLYCLLVVRCENLQSSTRRPAESSIDVQFAPPTANCGRGPCTLTARYEPDLASATAEKAFRL